MDIAIDDLTSQYMDKHREVKRKYKLYLPFFRKIIRAHPVVRITVRRPRNYEEEVKGIRFVIEVKGDCDPVDLEVELADIFFRNFPDEDLCLFSFGVGRARE